MSLDAPVIALVWQEAFARAFGAPVSWAERAVLFLVVWSVYAADHVADGLRLGAPEQAAARHQFALRRWRTLSVLVAMAGLGAVAAACLVPPRVIAGGAIIAGCVAVYFVWNQFAGERWGRQWAKEITVGAVFAAGCALAPMAARPAWEAVGPVVVFALVCMANCLLIARLERERDIQRGESSLAVRLQPHTRPARIIAAMAGVAAMALIPAWLRLAIPLLLSAAGIWCGVLVERRFGAEAAAVWADAVLLSPLLVFAAEMMG